MQSTLPFSVHDAASLFGVGLELTSYMVRLAAANCFARIRAQIEQDNTKLKSLTVRSFDKSSKKDTFKKNVDKVVEGGLEGRVLLPLVDGTSSASEGQSKVSSIDLFIIACFTLTDHNYKQIEGNGLLDIFPHLFRGAINTCDMLPELRNKFAAIIKDACDGDRDTGKLLLSLLSDTSSNSRLTYADAIDTISNKPPPATEPYSALQETSNIAPPDEASHSQINSQTSLERKRRRLDSSQRESQPGTSPERHEVVQPLVFDPEMLRASESIETEDPDDPPNHDPKQVGFQFSAAKTGQFEGLLRNSPLLQAIKVSRQWRWERRRDALSTSNETTLTDCIIALIPDNQLQDMSFVIKVGCQTGWKLIDYLGFQATVLEEVEIQSSLPEVQVGA